jgi:hypothetical protein
MELEIIYVNTAHTLNDPRNKVYLIEEAFRQPMFEHASFESLT